jgi:hypothetical protein
MSSSDRTASVGNTALFEEDEDVLRWCAYGEVYRFCFGEPESKFLRGLMGEAVRVEGLGISALGESIASLAGLDGVNGLGCVSGSNARLSDETEVPISGGRAPIGRAGLLVRKSFR